MSGLAIFFMIGCIISGGFLAWLYTKPGKKWDHPEKLWGKKKIVVLLYGNRLRTIITRRSTDLF